MVAKVASGAATRAQLVDAAEELLLTTSYDDLSVRAVCARAGANPAAVQYHFGSKEGLVAALLQGRLGPLWRDRLTELVGSPELDVRDCVEAVVEPLRDLAADPVGQVRLHLLARMVFRPGPPPWTDEWFAVAPFVELLRRSRPGLAPEEATRRWVRAFTLILLEFASPGGRRAAPGTADVEAMVQFVLAGLTAGSEGTRR